MKKITMMIMTMVLIISVTGCSISTSTQTPSTQTNDSTQVSAKDAMDMAVNSVGVEQRRSEKIQLGLDKAQPQPEMDWSLERENIINRTLRWNDPNKISYIYLLEFGRLVGYYPIKGKVSSVNSALSTPDQVVTDPNKWADMMGEGVGGVGSSLVMSSPQEDGSYGSNGDAIFFFLTDGTYMEWNGRYLLFDNPMKVSVEPMFVYEVN